MTAAVWAGLAVGGGLGVIARFTVDGRVSAAVARRRAARTGPPRRGARWAAVVPLGTIAVNLTLLFKTFLFPKYILSWVKKYHLLSP